MKVKKTESVTITLNMEEAEVLAGILDSIARNSTGGGAIVRDTVRKLSELLSVDADIDDSHFGITAEGDKLELF